MWGNAFADMAKKAQEQIQEQAQTLQSAGGMFNLDSLQSGDATSSSAIEGQVPTRMESSLSEGIVFSSDTVIKDTTSQQDTTTTSLFSTPTPSPPGKQPFPFNEIQKFPEPPSMGVEADLSERLVDTAGSAMDRGGENSEDQSPAKLQPTLEPEPESAQEEWDWNEDDIENGNVDDGGQAATAVEIRQVASTAKVESEPTLDSESVHEAVDDELPPSLLNTQAVEQSGAIESIHSPTTNTIEPIPTSAQDTQGTAGTDDDEDDLDDMYADDDDDEEEVQIAAPVLQFDSAPPLEVNESLPPGDAVGMIVEQLRENGEFHLEKHQVQHVAEEPEPLVQEQSEELAQSAEAAAWDFDVTDVEEEEETTDNPEENAGCVELTTEPAFAVPVDNKQEGPDAEAARDVSADDVEQEKRSSQAPVVEVNHSQQNGFGPGQPQKVMDGVDIATEQSLENGSLDATDGEIVLPDDSLLATEPLDMGIDDFVADAISVDSRGHNFNDGPAEGSKSMEAEAPNLDASPEGVTSKSEDSHLDDPEGIERSSEDESHCVASAGRPEEDLEDEIARELTSGNAVAASGELSGGGIKSELAPDTRNADLVKAARHAEKIVSESVMEDFAVQMRRLEDHHRSEMQEMERRHKSQLQETRDSFNLDELNKKQKATEQMFLARIKEKEEQVSEVMRINEGYQLKVDVMKRELAGTQAILEERDSAMGTASASHIKNLHVLEKKLDEKEQAFTDARAQIRDLGVALRESKDEIDASNEAYSTLKARVKVVATELKERRVECRTLAGELSTLTDVNEQLESQVATLRSQVSDRDRNQSEKDDEMVQLRSRVDELEDELKAAEKSLKERDAVGEKALSAYKKKAQNSLAQANARAAAAIEAKEEAELDTSAARSASAEAIDRAKVAEANGKAALAEAKEYVRDMEEERARFEERISDASKDLEDTRAKLRQANVELQKCFDEREKLESEVATLGHHSQGDQARISQLQLDLSEAQRRSNELYDEVETLRDELRKSANAAFIASSQTDGEGASNSVVPHGGASMGSGGALDKSEAEGTILMLQAELRDANQAIKELKETLRSTIEAERRNNIHRGVMDGSIGPSVADSLQTKATDGSSFDSQDGPSPSQMSATRSSGIPGNDATPLFFALEKQAELNTARDEINRLANMLGDAQSEKMEAFEAMLEMRRKMEEAEASLRRYEKLGSGMEQRQPSLSSSAVGRGVGMSATGSVSAESASNEGVVNLEYLKNVMLSYLNAKSLTERKALVPVVSAVLCLTPEEQANATRNVEASGSLEGVGMSLFESIGSQVKPFM